jgi:hypothetical protein
VPVGQRRRCLHQQGRLADAGIAADQQRRAAHEAAAGDAVEFGDAGDDAWRILDLAGKRGERDRPALAQRAQAQARQRCRHWPVPRRWCSTRRRPRTCPTSAK